VEAVAACCAAVDFTTLGTLFAADCEAGLEEGGHGVGIGDGTVYSIGLHCTSIPCLGAVVLILLEGLWLIEGA
jgi:hypothetical protein